METPLPLLFAGSAHQGLAGAISSELGVELASAGSERFPDREVHVELRQSPRQRDVFLVQPTSPPPDENLIELLAMADACRRAGAHSITAVVSYFGYARQDRRSNGLDAVAARLVADLIVAAGIQRLVTLDLHNKAIEGFFTLPVLHATAVSVLAEAIRHVRPENGVVVSPDLGAAKLAESYARLLDLPVAILHKTRLGPAEVSVSRLTGDVRGRTPIIVDDMISTGGTIEAAVSAVVTAGAEPDSAIVAATHGLFTGSCVERLQGAHIKRIFVTDSVPPCPNRPLTLQTVSVAKVLADSIRAFMDG